MEFLFYVIVFLSIALNVFFVWYLRKVLTKLMFVSANIGNMKELLNDFSNHIMAVYRLETFYGDQTLQNLMEHAYLVHEAIKDFEEIYELTDVEVEEEAGADEGEAGGEAP